MDIMESQVQTYVCHAIITVANVLGQQVMIVYHVNNLMEQTTTYNIQHHLVYKSVLMVNMPTVHLTYVEYVILTVTLANKMPLIVLVVICSQIHMYSFTITSVYENVQLTIMDKHLTILA